LTYLFDTNRVTTMKIHADSCGMLKTKGRRFVSGPADAVAVVDMRERGYGVSFCRCCPKAERDQLLAAAELLGATGNSIDPAVAP
jgi:hypothetical protein